MIACIIMYNTVKLVGVCFEILLSSHCADLTKQPIYPLCISLEFVN